eukprot:4982962-Prymnesium_polylepis.1
MHRDTAIQMYHHPSGQRFQVKPTKDAKASLCGRTGGVVSCAPAQLLLDKAYSVKRGSVLRPGGSTHPDPHPVAVLVIPAPGPGVWGPSAPPHTLYKSIPGWT